MALTECVFITDREFGDIKSILPSTLQFFSWHYFEDDIVNWVETNGLSNDEANNFINDVFDLMKSKTVDKFHRDLMLKRRQWPADFAQYVFLFLSFLNLMKVIIFQLLRKLPQAGHLSQRRTLAR